MHSRAYAFGALLVTEAGGKINNGRGIPLEFGLGRTLGENFGVVGAHADIHQKVLEAIAQEGEDKAVSIVLYWFAKRQIVVESSDLAGDEILNVVCGAGRNEEDGVDTAAECTGHIYIHCV